MNMIFLRGAVPPKNEHPEKLLYDKIENCEDMWTQLFYYTTKLMRCKGTILYQNGNRTFKVNESFTEKWVPSIASYRPKNAPDIIMCRGGFAYYDDFVKRYPKAQKIYYGAGKRYFPGGYAGYDIFLTDSKSQLRAIKQKKKNATLFIKPAATMFRPIECKKEYDICFMANASQAKIKRHKLLFQALAGYDYKILILGNVNQKLINLAKLFNLDVTWRGWSPRKELPKQISKCKIGICCSTNYDSCPRVIPEYLACDVPVVITSNVNFWHKKYVTNSTGILIAENKLEDGIKAGLDGRFSPRDYYDKNLSMDCAAKKLVNIIKEIS